MQLKDHYKILQVPTHASAAEIKKAYRLLAKQYHPDVMGSDPYAAALFADIKEAYETLIHPHKKNKYLEERWYQKSQGPLTEKQVLTPINILKEILLFEKSCHHMDVFRMNKTALYKEMCQLLDEEKMEVLKKFNDGSINQQIVKCLIPALKLLEPADAKLFTQKLLLLVNNNSKEAVQIKQSLQQVNSKEKHRRWQWLWILLITALLCLLIEWASK